jgi:hypothetical protein
MVPLLPSRFIFRLQTEPGAGSPRIGMDGSLSMTDSYVLKGNLNVACYPSPFAFVDRSAVVKTFLSGD